MSKNKVIGETDLPEKQIIVRPGDKFLEGANNTLVLLGTDRVSPDGPADIRNDGEFGLGEEPGTGTVMVVVGRTDPEGNPDINNDDTTLYLSRRTAVDQNLALENCAPQVQRATEDSGEVKTAALISDTVRVVGRRNLKITLDDCGSFIFIDGESIEIRLGESYWNMTADKIIWQATELLVGEEAVESIGRQVLGTKFMRDHLKHQHPSAVGPTGPPDIVGTHAGKTIEDYLAKKRYVGED